MLMLIFDFVSRYLDSYGVDSTKYGVAHSDELWQLWNIYFGVYWVNRPEVDLLSCHTIHFHHLIVTRTSWV